MVAKIAVGVFLGLALWVLAASLAGSTLAFYGCRLTGGTIFHNLDGYEVCIQPPPGGWK